jgi:hypothetical protein
MKIWMCRSAHPMRTTDTKGLMEEHPNNIILRIFATNN